MEIPQIALALSAVTSLVSLLSAIGTAVYAIAVLRTEVHQAQAAILVLQTHANNQTIHFNQPFFAEFEKRMDARFTTLEREIVELKETCDTIKRDLSER